MENFKRYIVLWVSQSISQLGSSMTAFALRKYIIPYDFIKKFRK